MTVRLRAMMILLLSAALLLTCCFVHVDGMLHPVRPALVIHLEASGTWYAEPALACKGDDPNAVYVVPNVAAPSAVRVDTTTGTQSAAALRAERGQLFVPAGASAEVRGLNIRRPAFHLFALPDGRGPGLHLVASATGVVRLRVQAETLLSRKVFNSSSTAELIARTWADPSGRWIASLSQSADGWTLYLFARPHAATRLHPQLTQLEEL